MAGISYTVEVDDARLQAALGNAFDGLGDLTDLMDAIGRALVTSAQERIGTTNISPDGAPWPPSRRAEREGGPTLHDTGLLMRSIVSRAGPRHVVVGTNVIYAAVHQEGAETGSLGVSSGTDSRGRKFTTPSPWGDIPARPFLGISDEDYDTIGDLAQLHLDGLLGGLR